jgi:hypothetical protein
VTKLFNIHISRVTSKGVTSKEFLVEKFGLYVNRYPDGHFLEGHVKDVQLAVVDEKNNVKTYPFIGLWISTVDLTQKKEDKKP